MLIVDAVASEDHSALVLVFRLFGFRMPDHAQVEQSPEVGVYARASQFVIGFFLRLPVLCWRNTPTPSP